MELLTPDLGLFLWNLLAFIILFFVLKKTAWKPILKSLKERETSISDSLATAEKVKAEMAQLKIFEGVAKCTGSQSVSDLGPEHPTAAEFCFRHARRFGRASGKGTNVLIALIASTTLANVASADEVGLSSTSSNQSASTELEEVTVTATRREESVEKVPISIWKVSGKPMTIDKFIEEGSHRVDANTVRDARRSLNG